MKVYLFISVVLSVLIFPPNTECQQPAFLAAPNNTILNSSSCPHDFIEFKGEVYFGAYDEKGEGIWKSDGTPSGTQLLKRNLFMATAAVQNDRLIIVGSDMKNIDGIWKSDGTSEGTVLIKKISKISFWYNSHEFVSPAANINDALFGIIDNNLWKIDGTSEGTHIIDSSCYGNIAAIDTTLYFFSRSFDSIFLKKTVYTGNVTSVIQKFKRHHEYQKMIAYKDTLYFFVRNDTSLFLYRSDGTREGTKILWGSSRTYEWGCEDLVIHNDTLYFATSDRISGSSTLWQFSHGKVKAALIFPDQSKQPIRILGLKEDFLLMIRKKDSNGQLIGMDISRIRANHVSNTVSLPDYHSSPVEINCTDSMVFFIYNHAIWKSDGSFAQNLTQGFYYQLPENHESDFFVGKKFLYFSIYDSRIGQEPWLATGNINGNRVIRDINQTLMTSGIDKFFMSGNKAIFTAVDTIHGSEPWVTDGTKEGTFRIKDIYPGIGSSSPHQYIVYKGNVYFIANKGTSYVNGVDTSCYLWKSDGTLSGTIPVKRVYNTSVSPRSEALELNDKFYFGAVIFDSSHAYPGLWNSDGSTDGTNVIKTLNEPSYGTWSPYGLTKVGNSIFFAAFNSLHGDELWKSDGSNPGTIDLNVSISPYSGFEDSNKRIGTSEFFLFSNENDNGTEPWVSDGTMEGTHMLADIRPGEFDFYPVFIGTVGDRVLFENGLEDDAIYSTDGTFNGTSIFLDDPVWAGKSVSWNDKLYFPAYDSIFGRELWCSDGTPEGTYIMKDIIEGSEGGASGVFYIHDGLLYFAYDNPDGTSRIWRTDGTPENTIPLYWNNNDIKCINAMAGIGDDIILSACDDAHGNCLYVYSLNATKTNDKTASFEFSVYPDPAQDHIRILLTGTDIVFPCHFEIINPEGVVVKSFVLESSDQLIDISGLSQGIYLIRPVKSTGLPVKRFIRL